MPYLDHEKKRLKDLERYQRFKAGGERPGNPLTPDEWRDLQRICWEAGTWPGERVDRPGAVFGIRPYRER